MRAVGGVPRKRAANWAIIIISRAGELKQTEQGPTTDPGVASMEASAVPSLAADLNDRTDDSFRDKC